MPPGERPPSRCVREVVDELIRLGAAEPCREVVPGRCWEAGNARAVQLVVVQGHRAKCLGHDVIEVLDGNPSDAARAGQLAVAGDFTCNPLGVSLSVMQPAVTGSGTVATFAITANEAAARASMAQNI
jgi:hypothetical protein